MTYDTFGGDAGVQTDEYGPDLGAAPGVSGNVVIDVTSSLEAISAYTTISKLRGEGS